MPGPSARSVVLSPSAKAEFEEIARSTTAPFRTVQRAKIALLAAQGRTNVDIAMKVGCYRAHGAFMALSPVGLAVLRHPGGQTKKRPPGDGSGRRSVRAHQAGL
jgi:hypothetical protein